MDNAIFGVASLLCALLVPPAGAQEQREPARRQGFWIAGGVGGGLKLNDTEAGRAYYVRLGGSPSERVLLAGEFNDWFREDGGKTFDYMNVTLTTLVYPSVRGGLFLKGSVGIADASITSGSVSFGCAFGFGGSCSSGISEDRFGVAFAAGLGYDVFRYRKPTLTLNTDFLLQRIRGADPILFIVSLGATWH